MKSENTPKCKRQPLATNDFYKSILSSLNIGIWKWKPVTDEIFLDDVLQNILGCGPEDSNIWSSQNFLDCIHAEDEFFRNFLQNKDLDALVSNKVEHRFLNKNGNWVWVLNTWNVELEGGQPVVIGSVRDISQRKNDEILAAKYKDLLDRTNEAAIIGTWEVDLIAQKVSWSDVTKRIHEVPADYEPSFENGIAFYKEGKNRERILKLFNECVVEGKGFDDEFIIETHLGNEKWVRSIGISVRENDECVKVYGVFQDIDEKARLIKRLELAEQIFRKTFDFAGVGMALVSLDLSWINVNKSLSKMLGYTKAELLKLKYSDLIHQEELENDTHLLKEALRGHIESFESEKRLMSKSGEIIWIILTISLVRDDEGNPLHFVMQFSDITSKILDKKRVQELLEITKDQNFRLLNFTHIVSHNLRSHSGNLAMLLNLMEMDAPEAMENEIFPMLKTAVGNLEETVQHLNEVAILNTKTGQNLSSLSLFDYLEKAITSIRAVSLEQKSTIVNKIDPKINVLAIPAYLDSILLNFLTNAIKYRSPERPPIIEVDAVVEDDNVVISFKDNGLGIDLKTHGDKLFGMYKTFHEAKDSRGLGLFITKNQIEAIGGKVWVKSTVGVGTTFFVSLKNQEQE
ncbi:PAS domain-containing sensor histidine kinase [Aequorivita echinoideorum]|uniref:histidine kinase n=1 Tax=Aequorivita echinoideorum TaxID=1549647 RepID=A0ABS5S4C1_9FLAO|nr:PAS domain S-box protein [Aequorivita echinoideorum]MBT0606700.1 PAS domain S-box protein [Aequorivita echinoideorum]